jgi:predicted DNA-binding protein
VISEFRVDALRFFSRSSQRFSSVGMRMFTCGSVFAIGIPLYKAACFIAYSFIAVNYFACYIFRMGISQVNFRMPDALKQKLQAAADKSGRTVTAEIVSRLERSFEDAEESRVLAALNQIQKEMKAEFRQALSKVRRGKRNPKE